TIEQRMKRPRRARMALWALVFAGIGGLAFAAPGEPLTQVNPELRSIAQSILRAQARADAHPPVRPAPPPVPAGVVERIVTGSEGQPPVTVYLINATAAGAQP